jgi:hypothetical protein
LGRINGAVVAQDAAVTVVGVGTEADVHDEEERGEGRAEKGEDFG